MKNYDNDNHSHMTLSITEVEYNKNYFTKYLTTGLTLTLFLVIIISLVFFLINNRILDFNFKNNGPFMTSPISIILILILIICMLSVLLFSILFNNDNHLLQIYYNEVSGLYLIMILLLIGPFIFGMIYDKSLYSIIINLLVSFLTLITSFLIFRRIKAKKNVSLYTLLSLNIGNCAIMSFEIYVILYNIGCLIYKVNESSEELRADTGIVLCILYGAISIAILTDYKDIVFCIIMEIINLGLLTNYNNLFEKEIVTSIIMSSFVFIAVIITVYKYRILIFGYEDDEDLIKALDKHRGSRNL